MDNDNEHIKRLQKIINFEVEDMNATHYSNYKSDYLAELEKNIFFNMLSFIEEIYNEQKENVITNSNNGLFKSTTIEDINNVVILGSKLSKIKAEKENLENFFKEAKDNRYLTYESRMKSHTRNIKYLQDQINDVVNSIKKDTSQSETKKSSPSLNYTFKDAVNDLNICLSNCNDEETRKEIEEIKLNLIKKHINTLKTIVENGYVPCNQTKGEQS